MSYLSEVERKQRSMDIQNGFTFEYTADLSGEILIHPPHEYTQEDLCLAVTQFIGAFSTTTFNRLDTFCGFENVNFKIV